MAPTKRVLLMCLGLIALATVAAVAAVMPGVAGRYVTRAPKPADVTDEQVVRRIWQVPDDLPCKALDAEPKASGFYGREGLRIVGTFEFFPGGLTAYRNSFRAADWRPLPLPTSVTGIRRGARELEGVREGFYLCLVQTHTPAGTPTWVPLDDPAAPNGYSRHTIGVLDAPRQRLIVICQNHY